LDDTPALSLSVWVGAQPYRRWYRERLQDFVKDGAWALRGTRGRKVSVLSVDRSHLAASVECANRSEFCSACSHQQLRCWFGRRVRWCDANRNPLARRWLIRVVRAVTAVWLIDRWFVYSPERLIFEEAHDSLSCLRVYLW